MTILMKLFNFINTSLPTSSLIFTPSKKVNIALGVYINIPYSLYLILYIFCMFSCIWCPKNRFRLFYNEVAAQKYLKRAKQSDLLVWQRDAARGKKFVVAPARQVFDYLRKVGPGNNIGFYEWITPAHAVYPVFDVDWYIFDEPEQ